MKRVLLFIGLIGLLSGPWKVTMVSAAGEGRQAAGAQMKSGGAAVDPANYVGSDTCMTCHADVGKSFSTNPHARLALLHGGKGPTCESCHGPGKAHVDGGGDATKIFRFTQASSKQIDATCLGCHAGAHPNFARSEHAKAGLSCVNCHSIHNFKRENALLRLPQPQLCYGCHTDVKPAFSQPFHHRVEEGLMNCSDCHNPHDTFQRTLLKSTADQNAICTKCHTETAGPFAYEHPVLKTEGCSSCHSPHGSQNPRLLNVSNINSLCLQCHSETNLTAFPHAVSPSGPAHNQAAQYVACTNCHTQVHGSNASPVFFK